LDKRALAWKGVVRIGDDDLSFAGDFAPGWSQVKDLGDAAAARGLMDAACDWYEIALEKAANATSARELGHLKKVISAAKQVHDHYLDKRGRVSSRHRCHPRPFDAKLAKKKKFKRAKRDDEKSLKLYPLHSLAGVDSGSQLSDNFNLMCNGQGWKVAGFADERPGGPLLCARVHHGNPYLRLGPFKVISANYPLNEPLIRSRS